MRYMLFIMIFTGMLIGADDMLFDFNFDEGRGSTVKDRSANGFHGTMAGEWASGKFGKALFLDGTPGKTVTVNVPGEKRIGKSSFTASFWMNPATLTIEAKEKRRIIAMLAANYPANIIYIELINDNGTISFLLGYKKEDGKSVYVSTGSKTRAAVNQWTHVAAVCDRENRKLMIFVNGKRDAEKELDASFDADFTGGGPLSIGSTWQSFGGALDDFKVMKRARADTEIAAEYELRRAVFTAADAAVYGMIGGMPENVKPSSTYYVSVDGNDSWSGTLAAPLKDGKDGPFRTLANARDVIRALKKKGQYPKGGVTVEVLKGLYGLDETFRLGAGDSGTADAPVTYRGHGNDMPTIIGGKSIVNFTSYKGSVMKANVGSQGFKGIYFRQLFFGGTRQQLARYPNYDAGNPYGGGWAYVDGNPLPMYSDLATDNKRVMQYRAADARTWAKPTEGDVFIFARYNWWNNIVRIASVDTEKRTYTFEKDASYAPRPIDRYYVRNLFEELDAPGEWYLDKDTWTLYFWPPKPLTGAPVYAPTLENIVVADKAEYVTFRGFIFECADNSAVVFRDCTNSLIAGCVVRNVVGKDTGGAAVAVSGGSNVGVVGCDIYEVGSSSISLDGGNRKTLVPSSHYAENNYLHHMGVFYKQGVGVNMNGVGQRASRNLIHDCPRFAVMFGGNDQVIEYNRMRHMNLETEDTGATYCGGRDYITPRGSVIRYNYISDSLGFGKKHDKWVSPYFAWGVYLDDNSSGVDVIGNIVVGANRAGMHLHNARDNIVSNNIFVNNGPMDIEFSGWTRENRMYKQHITTMTQGYENYGLLPAWEKYRGLRTAHPTEAVLMADNVLVNNIFYNTNTRSSVYAVRNFPYDRTTIDSNIVMHAGTVTIQGVKADPEKHWDEWRRSGMDRNSEIADPLFVDVENGDYRLKPESPALKLGFQQLSTEKIGPYKDELRVTWPIVEAEGVREHPIVCETKPFPKTASTASVKASVPQMKSATVDGAAESGEYPSASLKISQDPSRIPLTTPPCEARLCHDGKTLFVTVTVPVKDMSKLQAGDTWGKNDGVEICFATLPEGTAMGETFVLHGFTSGKAESVIDGGAKADSASRLGKSIAFAAKTGDNGWTAEFGIPLSAVGVTFTPGVRFAFNIGVRRTEGNEWVIWVGALGATHQLDNGGIIVLE